MQLNSSSEISVIVLHCNVSVIMAAIGCNVAAGNMWPVICTVARVR